MLLVKEKCCSEVQRNGRILPYIKDQTLRKLTAVFKSRKMLPFKPYFVISGFISEIEEESYYNKPLI